MSDEKPTVRTGNYRRYAHTTKRFQVMKDEHLQLLSEYKPGKFECPPGLRSISSVLEAMGVSAAHGDELLVSVEVVRHPIEPQAAVSYVEDRDGRLLAVWNRRYHGWAMPGGKVEDGETIEQTQARELYEETGLETLGASLIYNAPTAVKDSHIPSDRGRHVYVFAVVVSGIPKEMEEGCPVKWVTREEFLEESPFREFYREMFARVPR
jgi:8-oxo-dGTP diphosphatase